jgi:uncharacterized RDD family membrane protein YckC
MSSPASSEPAPLAVTPAPAAQRILAMTLAVIGILAVLLGLLYVFAATSLPATLEGSSHHGHHAVRAAVTFVIAAACFLGTGLTTRRRPAAGSGPAASKASAEGLS